MEVPDNFFTSGRSLRGAVAATSAPREAATLGAHSEARAAVADLVNFSSESDGGGDAAGGAAGKQRSRAASKAAAGKRRRRNTDAEAYDRLLSAVADEEFEQGAAAKKRRQIDGDAQRDASASSNSIEFIVESEGNGAALDGSNASTQRKRRRRNEQRAAVELTEEALLAGHVPIDGDELLAMEPELKRAMELAHASSKNLDDSKKMRRLRKDLHKLPSASELKESLAANIVVIRVSGFPPRPLFKVKFLVVLFSLINSLSLFFMFCIKGKS